MLAVTMVPRRTEMRTAINEGSKLSRAETELRKCLSRDTDELLLKSYSCALQKEILIQGRLYITPHHFCFYSSILGWETKTVIKVSSITAIKKDKTAHLFPNAIMIFTADRKYGFSTFAHRNKSFDVLQIVWKNEVSELPVSQELLDARIKLLKVKSKSVETSPISTPQHGRHPMWQLSLRGTSKTGLTDSDSSETDSPILLTRAITPTPQPNLLPSSSAAVTTSSPPTHHGRPEIPRVTVTTSAQSNSSSESLFADATDGNSKVDSNLKSAELLNSNLNSDRVSTGSDGDRVEVVSTTSSNIESNIELEMQAPRKRMSLEVKTHSPSACEPSLEQSPDGDDEGIVFSTGQGREGEEVGTTNDCDPLRGTEAADVIRGRSRISSVLNQILTQHPTHISLKILQKGLQDWCTPSNFINLLILVSILLLLISTASMVCKLSYVNPTFQPLLAWQPWCKLCSEHRSSKPVPTGGVVTDSDYPGGGQRERMWTVDFFEELVKRHSSDPEVPDDVK